MGRPPAQAVSRQRRSPLQGEGGGAAGRVALVARATRPAAPLGSPLRGPPQPRSLGRGGWVPAHRRASRCPLRATWSGDRCPDSAKAPSGARLLPPPGDPRLRRFRGVGPRPRPAPPGSRPMAQAPPPPPRPRRSGARPSAHRPQAGPGLARRVPRASPRRAAAARSYPPEAPVEACARPDWARP